jgi:diguanylate cyclase (GGDEF)-like protein/PAS domain S-box-containing protein
MVLRPNDTLAGRFSGRASTALSEIALAGGVAAAFVVLGLLALWFARQAGLAKQAEWALALTPMLALSVLSAVLIGLSRRYARAEIAVRVGEAQYRLLADNAIDMIVQADLDATYRYVSPSSRELLGREPHELIGTRPFTSIHPEDMTAYKEALDRLTTAQIDRITTRQRYQHKSGHWIWTEATFRLLRNNQGRPTGYTASVRDISQRHALEEQLREQARTDSLTGLPNRRAFEERLEIEWHRSQRGGAPIALLTIDVDHFKQFNDHFGHSSGDQCLTHVAKIIRQERRATDFVARLGGEEFVLILPDTDTAGAMVVGESIRARIEAAAIAHPGSLHAKVTASIGGAACVPDAGASAADLVQASDLAMYQAKHAGRNRVSVGTEAHGFIQSKMPTPALVA